MSATNKTENYELPLYTANDKPTYLGDWNATMNKLDAAVDEAKESGGESAALLEAMEITDAESATAFSEKVAASQSASQVQGIIDQNANGYQNASQVQGIIDQNVNGYQTADDVVDDVSDYTNTYTLKNILGFEEESPSGGLRGVECVYNICNTSHAKNDNSTAFYNIPEMYSIPYSSSVGYYYGWGALSGNVNTAVDYSLDKLPLDGKDRLVYSSNIIRVFGESTAYDIEWDEEEFNYLAKPQAADKRFNYNKSITPVAITSDNYDDFIEPSSSYAAAIGFTLGDSTLLAWTDGWNSSVTTTTGYAQSSKMGHLVYKRNQGSMSHAYYDIVSNDPNSNSRASYSIQGCAKWVANYSIGSSTFERDVQVSCKVELLYGYINTGVNPSYSAQSNLYFGGDCNLRGAENAFLNWCRATQSSTVTLNYFYLKGCEFNDEVRVMLNV